MYPISERQPATDNHGFFFLGNHAALDFLNTKPRIDGSFVELLPDFPSLLRWFRAAQLVAPKELTRLSLVSDATHRKAHDSILEWREDLRSAVELWEAGKHLPREFTHDLNGLLAQHPMLFRLSSTDQSEAWFPVADPSDLFAPLAYSAARLFSDEDRTRVRQCDACVLHFLDTSKKGTRRWCSMEVCGNRAKAAAFAARQREGS